MKVNVPTEIQEAIAKHGSVAYLRGLKATPFTLRKTTRVNTHGALVKDGTLIGCMIGSAELPVGTEGWLFEHPIVHYSAYVRVDDMDYPKAGADVILTGTSYTFVTTMQLGDHRVLVDSFKTVEHEPRVIGTVDHMPVSSAMSEMKR